MNDCDSVCILGVDLAWGEKNPDGITTMIVNDSAVSASVSLSRGDKDMFQAFERLSLFKKVLVCVDAPLICQNTTGSRPVDRECSRIFAKQEAGCHSVNRTRCKRPFRIADELARLGFALTADLKKGDRIASEVYPHPATVRFFDLEKTFKYKKGRVARKRQEFGRYQECLRNFIRSEVPGLIDSPNVAELLESDWSKGIEDQVDSILCAVVGYWHLKYNGSRSQILGDDENGHILIPAVRSRLPAVSKPEWEI